MSLIAGRGCRWPPRRDSVSPCAPLSGGRDTHDGHENSPILVFFSNLLEFIAIASFAAYAADPFDISLKSVGARIFLGVSITSSPFTWVPHANRTKLPVAGGYSDHTPCSRNWPCGPTYR